MSSIEHLDETCRPKYNTLRTFKNVPIVGTPSKTVGNKINDDTLNKNVPILTFSSENYLNNKYYTLPVNKPTGSVVEENSNGMTKSIFNSKVSVIKQEANNDVEIYSKTFKNQIKQPRKESINNVECDILNRNKFQKQNNEIPNYFFKNKKELKKLASKNNIIDCKRLELPRDEAN
jgi:hypothetical protein